MKSNEIQVSLKENVKERIYETLGNIQVIPSIILN